MEGGKIELALKGGAEGPMTGQVDARDFVLVNEPGSSSIVSTTPPGGDRSLDQAVKRDIDTSRVDFERELLADRERDGLSAPLEWHTARACSSAHRSRACSTTRRATWT